MKSVLISFIMFAVVGAALYFDLFRFWSLIYMHVFGIICLVGALIFAFKNLGSPFEKEHPHDKN